MSDTEPKDENDAAELVQTLLDVAPGDVFQFAKVQPDGSRKNYPVRVQLLRIDEEHQVLTAAQRYAKEQHEAPREYGDLYKEGQAVALLTKALRKTQKRDRPDGTGYYPPLFTDEKQLRQSFTNPEMAQCLNMYEIVRSKYGAIQTFDEGSFERWVALLAEPLTGPFFLSQSDSSHWPNLILRLARELAPRLPSTSPDSSESDPSSSGRDTGSFGELPEASSADGKVEFPTDRILTSEQAAELRDRVYGKKE